MEPADNQQLTRWTTSMDEEEIPDELRPILFLERSSVTAADLELLKTHPATKNRIVAVEASPEILVEIGLSIGVAPLTRVCDIRLENVLNISRQYPADRIVAWIYAGAHLLIKDGQAAELRNVFRAGSSRYL